MALLDSLLQSNSPAANILTNAGQVFGQGLARRGGLLGLPLGALIGGTAQAALQQRQLGIQKTLASQIRQQAELASDPAEREQMNSAAAIAEAGGDPSSLLHTTRAAGSTGAKTLTELWQQNPESAKQLEAILHPAKAAADNSPKNEFQLFQQNPEAAMRYAQMMHPREPKDNSPKSIVELWQQNPAAAKAFMAAEAALHPGSGGGEGAYKPLNPNDFTLTGTDGSPAAVMADKYGHTKTVSLPSGMKLPPKKLGRNSGPTRGSMKWGDYSYQTLKRPDGSMVATLAAKPSTTTEILAHYGLASKPPTTLYFKPGSTRPIALPPGVSPEDVEPAS